MIRRMCVGCLLVLGCGRIGFDTSTQDTDAAAVEDIDASAAVAALDPCSPEIDAVTVALFDFEGSGEVIDRAGSHGAVVIGVPATTTGPTGCGSAMSFPGPDIYVEIVPSPDFQLTEGSLEIWAQFPNPDSSVFGVLTRDAAYYNSELPDHFAIARGDTGLIAVRMQPDSLSDRLLCSDQPVPEDQWVHIAVNFGPPRAELYIDGVLQTDERTETFAPWATSGSMCNESYAGGLAGNNEPWAMGANTNASEEASTMPAGSFLVNGAIDHVRISRARRPFAP